MEGLMVVPGPWRMYPAGERVSCSGLRRAKGIRPPSVCNLTIIMTGMRRACIRVVGTREVPMSPAIESWTHRCLECGNVYEIDWQDRREHPRGELDRRSALVSA